MNQSMMHNKNKSILFVAIIGLLLLQFSCAGNRTKGVYAETPPSHEKWDQLLQHHVDAEGIVNYKGFIQDSSELNAYLQLLSLSPPNKKKWSREERMAFWINAYNAFTVKLIIDNYPVASIKDIGAKVQIPFVNTPWDIKFITIGDEKLDLNNIEHKKLRKVFDDPRVHFCVVCASKSCPKLLNKAFKADILDEQMDQQARDFLANDFRNQVEPNKLVISKIFSWYSMDFPKKAKFIEFLNQYAPTKINPDATIDYLHYNWNLNE